MGRKGQAIKRGGNSSCMAVMNEEEKEQVVGKWKANHVVTID